MRYLIFDTETTGRMTTRGEAKPMNISCFPHIISLSWIIVNLDNHSNAAPEVTTTEHNLIRLPDNVDNEPEALEVHGITKEMAAEKGMTISDALLKFAKDMSGVDAIIAHNMNFDRRMIEAEWVRMMIDGSCDNIVTEGYVTFNKKKKQLARTKNIHCTMYSTTEFCKLPTTWKKEQFQRTTPAKEEYKWPKLEELHEKLFGTKPGNLHDSLHDCLVCLRCYMKFVHNNDILDSQTMRQTFTDKGILV